MTYPPHQRTPNQRTPNPYVLVLVIIVAPVMFVTGILAWVNGREVGFGLLVVAIAIAVAFGCERITCAIRRR